MSRVKIEISNADYKDRNTEDEKDPSVFLGGLSYEGNHADQEVTDPNHEGDPDGPEEAMGAE